MLNMCAVKGKIVNIDLQKRDVTVLSQTPNGKDVAVKCHFWKNYGIDSDNMVHADRSNWREDLALDENVIVYGHMGNNGRIIARNYVKPDSVTGVNGEAVA